MRITFELTPDEYAEIQRSREWRPIAVRSLTSSSDPLKRLKAWWFRYWLTMAGLVMVAIGSTYLAVEVSFSYAYLVYVAGLVAVLKIIPITSWGRKREFERSRKMLESICLTEAGIEIDYSLSKLRRGWGVIQCIYQTASTLIISVDRNSTVVVPKRAFASLEDRQQFIDGIVARLAPARE